MNPIEERLVWFVLGVVFGAIASWLVFGSRRGNAPPSAAAVEPPTTPATATPVITLPRVEAPSPHPDTIASSRMIDVGAARAAGFNLRHADDLTVIDGIGPKIEDQLRANGVESFVKIAGLSADELLDILARGGASFRFANPESWPRQASLAAQNRWKELKQMHSERMSGDDTAANS